MVVWIEIDIPVFACTSTGVTIYMVVWIEMRYVCADPLAESVTIYMVVWIEITLDIATGLLCTS